jgi:HEAT repeat protein
LTDDTALVTQDVAEALAALRLKETVPILIEILRAQKPLDTMTRNQYVEKAAIHGLSKLNDPRAVDYIVEHWESLGVGGLQALVQMGDARALPALEAALKKTPSPALRHALRELSKRQTR